MQKCHHGLVVFSIVLCRFYVHAGTIFVMEVCGGRAPQLRQKSLPQLSQAPGRLDTRNNMRGCLDRTACSCTCSWSDLKRAVVTQKDICMRWVRIYLGISSVEFISSHVCAEWCPCNLFCGSDHHLQSHTWGSFLAATHSCIVRKGICLSNYHIACLAQLVSVNILDPKMGATGW
jgi:hypothetical protein